MRKMDGDDAARLTEQLSAAVARAERAEQRIEGIGALACDLLEATRPWEMQSASVRSAATRLTVALAAIPLPLAAPPSETPE